MPNLDEYDLRILAILQKDGKISTQDLAQQAGLSASPCWRRVRKLEEAGLISGYAALLDRRALGLNTLAYVHVSLTEHSEEAIAAFDRFVAAQEQIVECCSITGADDYLLKVIAPDPEALEHFIMKRILALGVVRNSTTHFVLGQKKATTALPLSSIPAPHR